MKKMRWVLSMVLLLVFNQVSEAQILKKLQKKVQDKFEQKASNKVEGEVDRSIDNALDTNVMGMIHGKNKVDVSLVPDSYPFSWKYAMEIQSDSEKSMTVDYFLEPNAEYFGFKMSEPGDLFMVIDSKNKFMITAFNKEKEKVAMAAKMPDYSEITAKENETDGFSYKSLPDKIIMGYNCKGIEATNEDFVMVFYFTNEAKVSFSDMFRSQQKQKTPNALKNYFKAGDKPLMMTMNMKDLKNKGKNTSMRCVSLEKNTHVFAKSDYKFM